MPSGPSVVWLRADLRIVDNPAFSAAAERGSPTVVLYVLDEDPAVARPPGAASRWWLHGSLTALGDALAARGVPLILRRGPAQRIVRELAEELDAGAVYWNRRYGAGERAQDAAIKREARGARREARSFDGSLLFEPWTIERPAGGPYAVYSAFWRACLATGGPRQPLPTPALDGLPDAPAGDDLADWGLLPAIPWAAGLTETWTPGEAGAQARLTEFARTVDDYARGRDRPGADATSRLSPHLRFGEVSPHQVWHAVAAGRGGAAAAKFGAELGWREFNYSLLFFTPDIAARNLREEFDAFPWRTAEPGELERWQQGATGFPLVDAGMRQLWRTGWMHNRVRMVTASFLVKNLRLDWRIGEDWFWDTLVDADPANNAANWQWVAGSGVDAAPYFRVFNPILQSRKFDPEGDYLRAWVDELAGVPAPGVHEPVGTPGYPPPMVDLKRSRAEALAAYDSIRR
ncbi:MAG: deoxyribodipyrimidine photo-lyase [Naasia sp.]|nr:deoxyribodipyrimidine photo-lyase [Naasia sp.]